MLDGLLNSGTQPLLRQLAMFSERRQAVLAGNIANIDTPGYRMRDLPVNDFRQALKTAWQEAQRPAPSVETLSPGLVTPQSPAGFSGKTSTPASFQQFMTARAIDRQPGLTFQDGSNRSVEHQMMQLTRNALVQSMALQLLGAQYSQLEAVISERA